MTSTGSVRRVVSDEVRDQVLRAALTRTDVARLIPMTDTMRKAADTMSPVTSKGSPKEIVRLSETTRAALVKRAADEGASKSDIMRRAIEKELGIRDE